MKPRSDLHASQHHSSGPSVHLDDDVGEFVKALADRKNTDSTYVVNEILRRCFDLASFVAQDLGDRPSARPDTHTDRPTGNKDSNDAVEARLRSQRREWTWKWAEIADKHGTLNQDVFWPKFEHLLERYFHTEPDLIAESAFRRHPKDAKRTRQFGVFAMDAMRLFVSETYSHPGVGLAQEFIKRRNDIGEFFPEYPGRAVVPLFMALHLSDEVVELLSKNDCYAVALGDEHLEVLNFEDVQRP